MKSVITILIALFYIVAGFSQSPDVLDAGPDIYLDTTHCTTLRGSFNPAGIEVSTSVYRVDSLVNPRIDWNINFSLLYIMDDDWSDTLTIPFDFSFFGHAYNKFIVGENGVLSFEMASSGQRPRGYCEWHIETDNALPSNRTFKNTIFGAYHDLDVLAGGEIKYGITGQAPFRKLVIAFDSLPHYSCTQFYTTQYIILHETSNIVDVYIAHKDTCANWNNGLAILGIQNATGDTAYVAPGKNATAWIVNTPTVWRFIPAGDTTTVQASFTWYDQNGTVIGHDLETDVCVNQTTTFRLVADLYYPASGNTYTVSDTVTVYYGVTSVEEENLTRKVKLFPNPATDEIHITYDGIFHDGKIQLFNTEGILIEKRKIRGNKAKIPLAGLKNGMYFLHIYSGQGNIVLPVIKK